VAESGIGGAKEINNTNPNNLYKPTLLFTLHRLIRNFKPGFALNYSK
jgi:hypothetical protein